MAYTFNKAQLRKRVHKGCVKALDETVILVQREMRLTLSKPGTGRIYRRSEGNPNGRNLREKGFHQASAPGHPPAVDTGTLRRSWQAGVDHVKDTRHIKNPIRPSIQLGTKIKYARALQYGWEPRNLKPRPYVNVAVANAKKGNKIDRIFDRQIAKAVNGR